MSAVATMKVTVKGFVDGVIINVADFDEKVHKIFEEAEASIEKVVSEVEGAFTKKK